MESLLVGSDHDTSPSACGNNFTCRQLHSPSMALNRREKETSRTQQFRNTTKQCKQRHHHQEQQQRHRDRNPCSQSGLSGWVPFRQKLPWCIGRQVLGQSRSAHEKSLLSSCCPASYQEFQSLVNSHCQYFDRLSSWERKQLLCD